jgi:steroid delta-isomerase-like uncharacterized protein
MKKLLALTLLAFALVSASFAADTASPAKPAPSEQAKNKAVARRVFEEIFNQGRFQVADEIYAHDFVNHGLHRDADLQEDQAAVHWEKAVLPDLTMTVDKMVAGDDLVTVVWTARGTNTVSAGGLPATGATVELRGITVWRIVDGKIREEWTSFDMLRVARQVAMQLKWWILGCLIVLIFLVWLVARLIRQLRLSRSTKTTS